MKLFNLARGPICRKGLVAAEGVTQWGCRNASSEPISTLWNGHANQTFLLEAEKVSYTNISL